MKDNFDLKNYLKENKVMENSNKYVSDLINEDEQKDTLRSKIREMVLAEMDAMNVDGDVDEDIYEAKKEEVEDVEDVEVDEEEVDVVDSEEFEDMPEDAPEDAPDSGEIMGHLEAAMDAARGLGDEKLMDQLGNTITFYTRQHIAK